MIEDDGKGFDKNSVSKGIGLKNIEDRVKALNGEFDIDTAIGRGTNVNINIPFK